MHLGDPVSVAVERPGIQQLVLGFLAAAGPVLIDQILIGVGGLRIVIAPPVPGVAGQRVEIPPVFLDVLAVIALGAGQAERTLLLLD